MTTVAPPMTGSVPTLHDFFQARINELRDVETRKLDDLSRLEIQRAELNTRVRKLRDELYVLQREQSMTGEVMKLMGKNKVLVKCDDNSKYVVSVQKIKHVEKSAKTAATKEATATAGVAGGDTQEIHISDLKPGARVAMRMPGREIHTLLPTQVDPMVQLMQVEKVEPVTFDQIGGCEKQIREIREVVELPIKHPELFDALGIQQPKGVLMYGPPGTGKTMLARAVATSTDAKFIRVTGSELVQKYIGEGARMVREMFIRARMSAPAIIFMDEVDSIGSTRSGGSDSEVQRTMMELLNQLDGFESTSSIKILMATNRIDILDDALLRPGRIDRKVEFPAPDEEGRYQILRIHSRRMNLVRNIDLRKVAAEAVGCSGAELRGICHESGMFALRERRMHVTQEDFLLALAKVLDTRQDKDTMGKQLWK